MKVSDILRVKGGTLFTVSPDQALAGAIETMAERDIGSLVVMSQGQLAGILTFREVMLAVAKNSGLPGISSSGWRTYGTISSVGCTVQAVTPASAIDALISFRNDRRPTGSSHSDALVGNSRCR